MKIKIMLLFFLLSLTSLSGCGGAITPPPESPVAPPTTPAPAATEPLIQEPTEIKATESATETEPVKATTAAPPELPTATVVPPTAEPAGTATPTQPAGGSPAPELTSVSTKASPSGISIVPQTGAWGGSATDTIITFEVSMVDGQPSLGNLGIVWFGSGDCNLNFQSPDKVLFEGTSITRSYVSDEFHFTLTGSLFSPTRIQGTLILHVEGCSQQRLTWSATIRPVQP